MKSLKGIEIAENCKLDLRVKTNYQMFLFLKIISPNKLFMVLFIKLRVNSAMNPTFSKE